MFEALQEIGTSAIDELKQLKEEQQVLEDRLARMEEEQGQVTEAVYERVRHDYLERTEALNDKARPLKVEARGEYAKLKALHESLQAKLETARLNKEELEFRHRLGEYDDESFQERVTASDEEIQARQSELGETEDLKQRFIDAVRSEEELEEPEPEEEPQDSAPDSPEDNGEPEEKGASEASDPSEESDSSEADDDGDETSATLQENGTTATSRVETIPPPPPGAEDLAPAAEATVLLKGPRLVIHRGDSVEEVRLSVQPITIGRGVKNDIRFISTSVSRQHAQVALADDGYAVSDMRSGNGTMVNGEPVVSQRELRDGDMIQVGSEVLVFRDR